MITLTPAYGRDYTSRKAVLADWYSDKDFILNDPTSRWDGKPANRQDLQGQSVRIRYAKLRKVMVINA